MGNSKHQQTYGKQQIAIAGKNEGGLKWTNSPPAVDPNGPKFKWPTDEEGKINRGSRTKKR